MAVENNAGGKRGSFAERDARWAAHVQSCQTAFIQQCQRTREFQDQKYQLEQQMLEGEDAMNSRRSLVSRVLHGTFLSRLIG